MPSSASGAAIDQAQNQLRSLARLQQRVTRADIGGLVAMTNEVAASVAATQAVVQQAQEGAGAAQSAEAALVTASANSRRAVSDFERDYYERHVFDRYLRFGSLEDEEAYRRREEERRQAIERAKAEGTPEGNLKANELAIDQLKDAGAHGADRCPEYKRDLDGLTKAHGELQRAMAAKPSVGTPSQEAAAGTSVDPLQSVAAKAPHAKNLAATLLAAGITPPASDNVGHGMNDRTAQPNSPVRGA
jgi:hypothetical protein